MTRRSFLKTIAGAAAALAIPAAVRKRTEAVIARAEKETNNVIRYEFRNGEFHEVHRHLDCELNPAWVNAPYETLVCHHWDILKIQFS